MTGETGTNESVEQLQRALEAGIEGEVYFDSIHRSMHANDASVYEILPTGVITPRSVADLVTIVGLCTKYGSSITARGGGTSQAGQAIGAGLALDFSKHMNRILALNVKERTVSVEPGIVLDELNAVLKPHGLQLPLDLSTANRATIGGMIANNSAGTRSVIYGKTIDYVEELTVVLSDGSVTTMSDLASGALKLKMSQDNLEGSIYRTVAELGRTHQHEIATRFPKLLRRVGGYNLDQFVPPAEPFNLARLIVGSEGTLGLVAEAKLRLVPLGGPRVLCSIQFHDLLEAMTATPLILQHAPSAVELVDRFLLDMTKGKIEFEPLRSFIRGDPGAVLLVELMGDSTDELPSRMGQLEADLRRAGVGHHIHRAIEHSEQARIWELRRAALGLTMAQAGDAKAISFVEDTAVSPDKLRDYIEGFQAILAKYDTEAGFYAHASVGLLHIRPVVNMKSAEGVRRFEAIADEVADLVLEFGGALSGEHGDGLVRAPFQERMFGPVLYKAFCHIKKVCDPNTIFNPGKIVHAPALTANLRFGAGYETPRVETAFDFSDFGGFVRATEQCSGVGACRKTLSGTMCPSYMATRNEIDSTRGRANALRQVFSGRLGITSSVSSGFAEQSLLPVLELCLECKACKRECPTGVDMARLKSEFLHQYHQRNGSTLKERMLSRADLIGLWGSHLAPVSNWFIDSRLLRLLVEHLLGLDRRRPLPNFATRSFTGQWTSSLSADLRAESVVLFADTFNNYYEPEHLWAAARLIEKQGGVVATPPPVCCGRPLISKGFLDGAARQAEETTRALLPFADRQLPILFCEPSCYSAVVDDHPRLLYGQRKLDAERVAEASIPFEEWAGSKPLQIEAGPKTVLVHGHCHQKALTGLEPLLKLLSLIPDSEVIALDSGCCGMAGSFGYEKYDISCAIARQRLVPALENQAEDTVIVSPGYSCRQQIKHLADLKTHTPMSLLDSLI